MPSDLQFEGDSVAVWLRGEKVASRLGNIVEVWRLEDNPDLDPVVVLEAFLERRADLLGPEEASYPVFIHEDKANLTKQEFNMDLKKMLSNYPELAESSRDFWAGHSFR